MSVNLKTHSDWFDRNFIELSDDAFATSNPMWKRIAKVVPVDDWTVKMNETTGLGLANETGVYAGPVEETPQQMYTNTATQVKWTKSIQITEAAARFATNPQYILDKYRAEGQFSAFAKSMDDRKDRDIANYYANAQTSSIAATPDGAALASIQHPVNPSLATTYNINYATGSALTAGNVESALQLIGECSDYNNQPGDLLMNNPAYLTVPTPLEGLARRIAQTQGVNSSFQGTGNNDMNPLPSMGLQSEVWGWSRLGNRYQGNNDTDWYITIPGLSFQIVQGSEVEYNSWIDNKTGAYYFMAKQYFVINIKDFRGIFKFQA